MNKKGFTLVEVLATISLLAIISLMASTNIINLMNKMEKDSYNTKKDIIESIACTYIELNKNASLKEECKSKGCSINTDLLIEEGLLNKEDVDKYEVINIYYENKEKICKVKDV